VPFGQNGCKSTTNNLYYQIANLVIFRLSAFFIDKIPIFVDKRKNDNKLLLFFKTSAFVGGLIEIEYLCTRKVFITNENLFSFPLLNRNFALSLHRES